MPARNVERVTKRAIHAPSALNEAYDYASRVSFSRGMRVELGSHTVLFISGTSSVDDKGASVYFGDFRAQTRRTFTNIKTLLESEGADWHDIVWTTCYVADMRNYAMFNEVRNQFYDEEKLEPYPASTCVEARICRSDLEVEVEAIAIIPKDRAKG